MAQARGENTPEELSPEQKQERKAREDQQNKSEAIRRAEARRRNQALLGIDKPYNWTRLGSEEEDAIKELPIDPRDPEIAGVDDPDAPPLFVDQTLETGVYRDKANSPYSFYYDKAANTVQTLGGGTRASYREAMFFLRDKVGCTGITITWPKGKVDEDMLEYLIKTATELRLKVTLGEDVKQYLRERQKHILGARAEPDAARGGSRFSRSAGYVYEAFAQMCKDSEEISKTHFDDVREQLKVHDAATSLEKMLTGNPNRLNAQDAVQVLNSEPGAAHSAAAQKIKSDFEKSFPADMPPAAKSQKIEAELKKLEERQKKLEALQEKVDARLDALRDRKEEVDAEIVRKEAVVADPTAKSAVRKAAQKEVDRLKKESALIDSEQRGLRHGGKRTSHITEEAASIKLMQEVLREKLSGPQAAPQRVADAPAQQAVAPEQAPAAAPQAAEPLPEPAAAAQAAAQAPAGAPAEETAPTQTPARTPSPNEDALTQRLDALRDTNKSFAHRVNPTVQPLVQRVEVEQGRRAEGPGRGVSTGT